MKVVVAQKGAREHFLAARALQNRGFLAKLVVDWYPPQSPLAQRILAGIMRGRARSALAARAEDLPSDSVQALRLLGLWSKWQEKIAAKKGKAYEAYEKTDALFARSVARLKLPAHEVFFGYSYASLEALEAEKRAGKITIVDQIDPGPVEHRLVSEEMSRHLEVAGAPGAFPTGHFARARREWEIADIIIVNSEWTRTAIISEGAAASKIEILPLAYEPNRTLTTNHSSMMASGGALKVLWLGQVNVRKGIYYLLEAARLMEKLAVEFHVAGPLQISRETLVAAPRNVKWLGPIPRDAASELYQKSDIFVLPTLSDGFAITQIEAMAHGLPVITTPNCGAVVENGSTGFIIPAGDAAALAEAISKFAKSPGLAKEMSTRCIAKAKSFSLDRYGQSLMEIIQRFNVRRQGSTFTAPLAANAD